MVKWCKNRTAKSGGPGHRVLVGRSVRFFQLIFSVIFHGADFRVQERSKTNSCRSEGGVQVIEPPDRIIRTEPTHVSVQ